MSKKKPPFNYQKYLKLQKEAILERMKRFNGKLYLEFGGKLFDDEHAARVLPGFETDAKARVLATLKDQLEIIICINAKDIITGKIRGDTGLTYQDEVVRMIDELKDYDLLVSSVVITKYQVEPRVRAFRRYLSNLNIKTYAHYEIDNYPLNVELILSKEGFGKNDLVETSKPLVVVAGPGPGSGKLAVCLSMLYADAQNYIKSGYAKYETFPTWNLSLTHPLNLAYEAATLDLNDVLMVDHFHLIHFNVNAVSYNRDLEAFPLLKRTFERLYGVSPYQSPTEMGVNKVGFAISDEKAIQKACEQEIIRRYFRTLWENKCGIIPQEGLNKIQRMMERLNLTPEMRPPVTPALEKSSKSKTSAAALSLDDGVIVTGKKSELFTQGAAVVINALKHYAGVQKKMPLLSENLITTIQKLKIKQLGNKDGALNVSEVLITLAITASSGPLSSEALKCIPLLRGGQLHSSHVIDQNDISTLNELGIDVTFEPQQTSYYTNSKRR